VRGGRRRITGSILFPKQEDRDLSASHGIGWVEVADGCGV
jgi:hypothetical protein